MTAHKKLFIVGPARSGTTYVMVQLNQSDDVFLFSELNSFRIHGDSSPGFATAFNSRKTSEGNTRQKGSFIPNAGEFSSVADLYQSLASTYTIVGEKVALSGPPTDGKYPAQEFFGAQVDRAFNDYHLLLLRDPAETLDSMLLKFPDTPIEQQFAGMLHTFERLLELCWILPRARVAFYERTNGQSIAEILRWLGLDGQRVPQIEFRPKERPDFRFRRAELRQLVPGLERLELLYAEWLRLSGTSPFWHRQEQGDFRSESTYELVSAGLRGLLADLNSGHTPGKAPQGRETLQVRLQTNHPVALDSVDHQQPLGTKQDNYRSPAFTSKLLELYAGLPVAVLDLGCAGGGFVKEVTEAGHLAVGLEGSDYSLRHQRAEWATIPDRLFTCDCTCPFSLSFDRAGESRPGVFQVITAWEFLEHIPESRLPSLFENIKRHLHPTEGLFIASIHLRPCIENGIEYHATVRPEWWWRSMFMDHGFFPIDRALDYFDDDWVRGASPEQNAFGSCHVVLSLAPSSAIVRRVDRVAAQDYEHARLGRSEMKQMVAAARAHENQLVRELSETRAALVAAAEANTANAAYTTGNLRRLAAHAIHYCHLAGYTSVAFYGIGAHTRHLLPIWRSLGGPNVVALVASKKTVPEFEGLPVFPLGATLPTEIAALVPSSHVYESDMRSLALTAYPNLPWLFLWDPVATATTPHA